MNLKFRAWDKKNDLIKDVITIYLSENAVELHFQHGENPEYKQLHEVVLMQSTGIRDTNGTEIFEGDVVRVTDGDERTDFSDGGIGTICGLDDLYMWYIDGQVHNGLFDISRQYYIEVIGNVHENPELMEVAE